MVDIGTAPNSTNVAKVIVDPNFPNTLVIIGADQGPGTANGPSRKTLIFEDLTLTGNLDAGLVRASRIHLHDGGVVPHPTETPRLSTEVSISELSIIGAGRNDIPNVRRVKVYDNLVVANDLTVTGVANLNGSASVTGAVDTTGDVNAGSVGAWQTVRSQNMVCASGTFHLYDRGAGIVSKMCCGFGFDVTTPIDFLPVGNMNYGPLAGLPVAVILLSIPVAQAVVTITPWMLGAYDETTLPTILPILITPAAASPNYTSPTVTIKGPANPTGTVPLPVNSAQQIEVGFWYDGIPVPVTPVAGSPATDFVFDVTVTGYPVA